VDRAVEGFEARCRSRLNHRDVVGFDRIARLGAHLDHRRAPPDERARARPSAHTHLMPYDEALAARVRDELLGEPGLTEKRMFGGLGFMVDGNMAVAASSSGDLMVRADPDSSQQWIDGESVRPMEMRGRPMTGWLLVSVESLEDDAALKTWVARGVAYARSLPSK
jgi:hypothetical protein